MPDQVTTAAAKVATETDWASVAIKLIDADPLKYVIGALLVLLLFFGWILAKFIDAKFISRQVTKVVTAAGGVQASNQCAIDANKKFAEDLEKKLKEHAEAVLKDRKETREEIATLRRELNDRLDHELLDLKKALGGLAAGNKTTGEAIAKYQADADWLKSSFRQFATLFKDEIETKKKAGG